MVLIFNVFITREKVDFEYIRIHIRANSNQAEDQTVKYKVRNEVVKLLIPLIADCESYQDALKMLNKNTDRIKAAADRVLRENGFMYRATVSITLSEYPARVYDGFVLKSGLYEAVVIGLGDAAGDNWWCVAFPPLCFIPKESDGTDTVKYRSKILEIIRNNR